MPFNAERMMEVAPERNARGIRVVEQWEVFPTDGSGNRDPSGYVPPYQAIGPQGTGVLIPNIIGLPNYGDAHGTYPSCLCAAIQVVHVVGRASIIVAVEYRSYGLYQGLGGSRSRANGQDLPDPPYVPIWRKITITSPGGTFTFYRLFKGYIFHRQRMSRVEPVLRSGNEVDLIADAIQANVGKWYQIGGNYYLLSGRSPIWYDGLAKTRVEYIFDSWSRYPAIAANNPFYRNAVAVPALSNLEMWQTDTNETDQNGVPIITVVPILDYALAGGTLPGFP